MRNEDKGDKGYKSDKGKKRAKRGQEGNGYARKGMALKQRDKKGGSFLCPKKVL